MTTQQMTFHGVLLLAVVILGLSKGGFAGLGMVSTPMLALVTGPLQATGLLLPIMLVQDVQAMWLYRRWFDWRRIVRLLFGAIFGIFLGYHFATRFPVPALELTLGLLSCLFAFRQLLLKRRDQLEAVVNDRRDGALAFSCGAASAFTSTVAHAGTPPFLFYMLPKRLTREVFIASSVYFFAALNLMKVPAFVSMGTVTASNISVAVCYVPIALAANAAGAALARRIAVARFLSLINLILFAIGCVLIARGIYGLA